MKVAAHSTVRVIIAGSAVDIVRAGIGESAVAFAPADSAVAGNQETGKGEN